MSAPTPSVAAELIWSEAMRLDVTSGATTIAIDGDNLAGPTPMQLVAIGVAGCMAMDVVSILQKGRHPLSGLRASLSSERTSEPPRRFTRFTLHLNVSGGAPGEAVERAIALSRDKYCSVWHSLRQDIALTTTFDLHP